MKTIKGFFVGAVIAGVVCFGLGYNYGRGAPMLSNPFQTYTLGDKLRQKADQAGEQIKRSADEAKETLKKSLD